MKLSIILVIIATFCAEICIESSITLSVNKNNDLHIAIIGAYTPGYVFLDNKIVLDALYSNNYRTVIMAGVHNIAHNVTSSTRVCVNYAEQKDNTNVIIGTIAASISIIFVLLVVFCIVFPTLFQAIVRKYYPDLAKRLDEE